MGKGEIMKDFVVQFLSLYDNDIEEFDSVYDAVKFLNDNDHYLWILWDRSERGDIIVSSNLSGKSYE